MHPPPKKKIFSLKLFFDLQHTTSFILCTFLFIFHMKPCSQVSCLCYVDADKEKVESTTWRACVHTFFACLTCLASSPARQGVFIK